MKKVIITGADGFVGSYTVKHFLNEGVSVLAIDISETPYRLEGHSNLEYLKLDIADTEGLLKNIIAE